MDGMREYEISAEGSAIKIKIINPDLTTQYEYYQFAAIKSIVGVEQIGFGTRQADNNRKNPVRHTDLLEFVVNFHDENESAPLKYSILDVSNQATWTPNTAGLAVALADINGWLGLGSASGPAAKIEEALTDVTRTANFIRSSVAGTIAGEIYSYSIFNAGLVNGTVLGTILEPGETVSGDAGASGNKFTTGSITYDGTGTDLAIDYVS